jgi:1-deoxy-D-xylulose-5-phosphate synthase
VLAGITTPADLRALPPSALAGLAEEIRTFLVDNVARTGGHLGSNLGVVELTIAVHRVFSSPRDLILFDTGHQSYVHKILTGRRDDFDLLRQEGGLSGYPCRAESAHDVVENSHASTALSYADGLAKALELGGAGDRRVVAVVGDGAMTGGMCWEALNNLGEALRSRVVVVLNDNGRSYAPTVGGLARHLATLRSSVPHAGGSLSGSGEVPGGYGGGYGGNVFESLGLAYLGPVDGHDVAEVERALRAAAALHRPVVVHCVTRKGKGYPPAEDDELDCMHAVGAIDPVTGRPPSGGRATWTSVFAEEIAAIGAERDDVVCLTAAMLDPAGLGPFAARFPDRVFDVGIAEQHAVASAAGLAMGGMHPVVVIYAAFVGRAFDQLLMDVALHRLPVTIVADRAGVTGPDGPSHHGMWDASILPVVPGLRIGAPRDPASLRRLLREAVGVSDGPTAIRYPKATAGPDIPALRRTGGCDVLREDPGSEVLLVAVGSLAGACLDAAEQLAAQGVGVTVVDPCWIAPLDEALLAMAGDHRLVLAVEDTSSTGALGSRIAQALAAAGSDTCAATFALLPRFLPHGTRDGILSAQGLDAGGITTTVLKRLAMRGGIGAP